MKTLYKTSGEVIHSADVPLIRDLVHICIKEGISLRHAQISYVTFSRSDFPYIRLPHVHFSNCDLSNCDLSNCDLSNCLFSKCNFSHCKFSYCEFSSIVFSDCEFSHCEFWHCDFSHCEFWHCEFSHCLFSTCEFPKGEFRDCGMPSCDFFHTEILKATLVNTRLPIYSRRQILSTNEGLIYIDCRVKTIKDWEDWFESEKNNTTQKDIEEFKRVYAHFVATKEYLKAIKEN